MAVQLFKMPSHPGRLAVSSIDGCVPGGTLFLDFSKPIRFVRGNKFLPIATVIRVPVIHESEAEGGWLVEVSRWTPMWHEINKAWKFARAGRIQTCHVPTGKYDASQIVADFARQFPEFV